MDDSIKLLTSLIVLTFSFKALAQDKLNKLSINPIQLFATNFQNFEFERGVKDGKLGVAFFYGWTGTTTRQVGDYYFYGSEQSVSLKSYSKSISQSSFWYGGKLSVASGDVYGTNGDQARNIGTLGVHGILGYQVISGAFYMDFFGGLGLALTNNLFGEAYYEGDIEETNILPTLGIRMGIAF